MQVALIDQMFPRRSVPAPLEANLEFVTSPLSSARDASERPFVPSSEVLYDRYFDFVWRNARRMGVAGADADDVVQEVFVIVHRRSGEFASRSSIETWLFGILIHVVQHHRRSKARWLRRIEALLHLDPLLPSFSSQEPLELLTRREQASLLQHLLDGLDDEKRAVFLLVELEQKSVPEVAAALNLNVNTVYSRLRAARQRLEKGVARLNASAKELSR